MSLNLDQLDRVLDRREREQDPFIRGKLGDLAVELMGEPRRRRRMRNALAYPVITILVLAFAGSVGGYFAAAFGLWQFTPAVAPTFQKAALWLFGLLAASVVAFAFPDQVSQFPAWLVKQLGGGDAKQLPSGDPPP